MFHKASIEGFRVYNNNQWQMLELARPLSVASRALSTGMARTVTKTVSLHKIALLAGGAVVSSSSQQRFFYRFCYHAVVADFYPQ